MTPDELKLLLDVQSEGYMRAIEVLNKEWRERFGQLEIKYQNIEKKLTKELEEIKRSLEFSQKENEDLKETIAQIQKKTEDHSSAVLD